MGMKMFLLHSFWYVPGTCMAGVLHGIYVQLAVTVALAIVDSLMIRPLQCSIYLQWFIFPSIKEEASPKPPR